MRLVVSYGPGNVTDQVARIVIPVLSERWEQQVVIENMPGAGGTIGARAVSRAVANGYTLVFSAISALATAPHFMAGLGYDPLVDFTPIVSVVTSRAFLTVHPSLPVTTFAELVAHARARPANDPLFYYSTGNGTTLHINFEDLKRRFDFPAQHVPYRAAQAGLTDQLAGRVHMAMDSVVVSMPHVREGRLRPIFFTGQRRHPARHDIPTMAEVMPGVRLVSAWLGILGPAGVPEPLVARINADLRAVLREPDVVARIDEIGFEIMDQSPSEFGAMLREDFGRMGRLVQELGLTAD